MSATVLYPLRPGIWVTETAVPGFHVRGVVLVWEAKALVWDTLSRPADMEPVRPLVKGREVVVVYSHADWDHAWGTAGLPDVTDVVAHRVAAERLAREGEDELLAKRHESPGVYDDVRIVLPTVTFAEDHEIELDAGTTLQLRSLRGHTPDSVVGLLPELGILLAGDAVETPLPLLNEGSPVREWIAGLERWASESHVELVVPAHGEVGGRDVLRRTAGYLHNLLAGVTEPPAGGLDAFYQDAHERNVALVREGRVEL